MTRRPTPRCSHCCGSTRLATRRIRVATHATRPARARRVRRVRGDAGRVRGGARRRRRPRRGRTVGHEPLARGTRTIGASRTATRRRWTPRRSWSGGRQARMVARASPLADVHRAPPGRPPRARRRGRHVRPRPRRHVGARPSRCGSPNGPGASCTSPRCCYLRRVEGGPSDAGVEAGRRGRCPAALRSPAPPRGGRSASAPRLLPRPPPIRRHPRRLDRRRCRWERRRRRRRSPCARAAHGRIGARALDLPESRAGGRRRSLSRSSVAAGLGRSASERLRVVPIDGRTEGLPVNVGAAEAGASCSCCSTTWSTSSCPTGSRHSSASPSSRTAASSAPRAAHDGALHDDGYAGVNGPHDVTRESAATNRGSGTCPRSSTSARRSAVPPRWSAGRSGRRSAG